MYTPRGQSPGHSSAAILLLHIFNVLLGMKHFMVPVLANEINQCAMREPFSPRCLGEVLFTLN